MKNHCPIFPILPTSENQTLTYLQQIEHLTYKVNKAVEKVAELETKITDLATIQATGDSEGYLTSLKINQDTYEIPNNGVVVASGDDNTLETLEVDGQIWNVPPEGSEVTATADGEGNLATITIDGVTYEVRPGGSNVSFTYGADGYVQSITIDGVTKNVTTVVPVLQDGNLIALSINGIYFPLPSGGGSNVSATGTGSTIETITINGQVWNVPPEGSEVTASGTGSTLEQLTIDGETWDIPSGAADVSNGVITFYDAMLHLYAATYNRAGKALSIVLGDISAWSGTTTITFTQIPGLLSNFVGKMTAQVVTFSGSDPTVYFIPLRLQNNGGVLTLSINPDDSAKVCKIEADGTVTGYTGTSAELKLLAGQPLTFIIQ